MRKHMHLQSVLKFVSILVMVHEIQIEQVFFQGFIPQLLGLSVL